MTEKKYAIIIYFAVVLLVPLILKIKIVTAQEVEPQYKKYFYWYEDNRSLIERAFNAIDVTMKGVGRSVALIAGVSYYPNFKTNKELLPAAVDIEKMKIYLKEYEFFNEIIILKNQDMTYKNLQYFLQEYIPSRVTVPKSRFLFIYSGHGMEDGSNGYLLTSDARHLQHKGRSINLRSLKVLIDEVVKKAYYSLVLLNACYSGAFLRTPFGNQSLLPLYRGAHAITAGAAGELTWASGNKDRGSDFFEKLLAGLEGRADTQPIKRDNQPAGDGIITVSELYAYLEPEIQLISDQKQNPKMGDIYPNQSIGSFFFLNRLRLVDSKIVPPWEPKIPMGDENDKKPNIQKYPTNTVVLTIQKRGTGQVTVEPAGLVYAPGTTVTIMAQPELGWKFVGWEGEINDTANPLQVKLEIPLTVRAVFEKNDSNDKKLRLSATSVKIYCTARSKTKAQKIESKLNEFLAVVEIFEYAQLSSLFIGKIIYPSTKAIEAKIILDLIKDIESMDLTLAKENKNFIAIWLEE